MNRNLFGIFIIAFCVFLVFIYSTISSLSYVDTLDIEKILDMTVKREVVQSILAILMLFLIFRYTNMQEVKETFRKSRGLFMITFLIMFFGFLIGMMMGEIISDFIKPMLDPLLEAAREIEAAPTYVDVLILFGNNSRVTILWGIVYGALVFLGLPFIFFGIFGNGLLIGVIPHLLDVSYSYLLIGILPHGIFEIPAIILAGVCGFKLNISLLKGLWYLFFPVEGKTPSESFLTQINEGVENLRLFYIIIPLLIVAAIVEATVTPFVLNLLFG